MRKYRSYEWNDSETKALVERLNRLRKVSMRLNEDNPNELSKQIETYAKMLGIIGDLYSQATYRQKKSYADRKQKGGTIVETTAGTVKLKDAASDSGTYRERLDEAKYEAEKNQWEYAYDALKELINAKKKTHEVLMAHLYGRMG